MTKSNNCKPCEDKSECIGKCVEHAVVECKKKCRYEKYVKLAKKLLDTKFFVDRKTFIKDIKSQAILGPRFSSLTNAIYNQTADIIDTDFFKPYSWVNIYSWKKFSPLYTDAIFAFAIPVPTSSSSSISFNALNTYILEWDQLPLVLNFPLNKTDTDEPYLLSEIIATTVTNSNSLATASCCSPSAQYQYALSLLGAIQSIIDESHTNILSVVANNVQNQALFGIVDFEILAPATSITVKQVANIGVSLLAGSASSGLTTENFVIVWGSSSTIEIEEH